MNKNLVFVIGVVAVIIGAGFLFMRGGGSNSPLTIKKEIKVGQDVCAQFPKEWVGPTIGKTITKTEKSGMTGLYVCQYFIDDTDFVTLRLNDLSFENQKKGQEKLGRTTVTNDKIPLNHFIAMQGDGVINDIVLEINPNVFLAVDRSSLTAASETEIVNFAIAVAQRIKNGENQVSAPPTTQPTTTQPTTTTAKQENNVDLVNNFFKSISDGKLDEPMYKAMKVVNVKKVEESSRADWKENWQQYMVTLEVEMDPSSANQPIPYYGFEKGENVRFITLVKQNNQWKIEGLSTGP